MHSLSAPEATPDDPLPPEPETEAVTPGPTTQNSTPSGIGSRWEWVAAVRTFFSLKLVLPPGTTLSFEEIYKRRLFSSLIIPGIAILLTFGLHHLFNANYIEGSLDVFASLWLIFSVLWLRQLKKGLMIYRINASLLALLFLFLDIMVDS